MGATSANLGSGFDALGLCLDWYDIVRCTPASRTTVQAWGPDADHLPRDETNLIVRSVRAGLERLGVPAEMGLALECHNAIPQARGLGSSAAAIVAGLTIAWGLARPDVEVDRVWVATEAARLEGHRDNAFAAALGGAILTWDWGTEPSLVGHQRLRVEAGLVARLWVPEQRLATSQARDVLPARLPRSAATEQAVALALLVQALDGRNELFWSGTRGEWHQQARAALMPQSAALVASLRAIGVPAAISGAGPTVVALGRAGQLQLADEVPCAGFEVHEAGVGEAVSLRTDEA